MFLLPWTTGCEQHEQANTTGHLSAQVRGAEKLPGAALVRR